MPGPRLDLGPPRAVTICAAEGDQRVAVVERASVLGEAGRAGELVGEGAMVDAMERSWLATLERLELVAPEAVLGGTGAGGLPPICSLDGRLLQGAGVERRPLGRGAIGGVRIVLGEPGLDLLSPLAELAQDVSGNALDLGDPLYRLGPADPGQALADGVGQARSYARAGHVCVRARQRGAAPCGAACAGGASRTGASDTADATQAQGDGRALSPHLAGSRRRVRPSPATRLFRQPGGFKGLGPVEILDDSRGPAVANRPVQRRWRSEDVASRDRASRPSDATTRKMGAR